MQLVFVSLNTMSDQSTDSVAPALPTFLPNPNGTPVATFAMQKVLTKAIRSHAANQNLSNTKVKGADKMGGKRGGKTGRAGRAGRGTSTKTTATGTRK